MCIRDRINAIYRRAVTCDIMRNYDKVQPFIKAAENNDVCLIGDFKTQVIHNKIVFKILHDDMTSAFLTDEEKPVSYTHLGNNLLPTVSICLVLHLLQQLRLYQHPLQE